MLLDEITKLFDTKIGNGFSKEDLKKFYAEGKDRYADFIPPGFSDQEAKKKKGDRHIYGDLLIWKELIQFTKQEKKPLIFVTDDRKEDWWTIENGKTIRPREELVKEFHDSTGIRILIYNADTFLKFAKERKLIPRIKESTIKEVNSIRVSDEKKNSESTEFGLTTNSFVEKESIENFLTHNWYENTLAKLASGTSVPNLSLSSLSKLASLKNPNNEMIEAITASQKYINNRKEILEAATAASKYIASKKKMTESLSTKDKKSS